MKNNIEGEDEIKGLFKSILGVNIKVKDNIDNTEELVFTNTIQKLEDSYILEENLFSDYGISITQITDPLWQKIENDFSYLYGDKARETIIWYIYDRKNAEGEVIALEQEDGELIKLETPTDLWEYIKNKSK